MDSAHYGQYSLLDLQQFLLKSSQIHCKIVGTIKTIFKHKKYIIEVFLNRKSVILSYKRYNQFEALYELILMKYKNYNLGQFPSKFQILNKEETRKSYFQNMLNQIIKDHSQEEHHTDSLHETSRRLLSIIFLFLTSSIEEQKQKKQRKAQIRFTQKKESNDPSAFQVRSQDNQRQGKYDCEQKFLKQKSNERKHKLSLDLESDQTMLPRPRSNSLQNQFLSQLKQAKTHANEFEVKFSHQQTWKKRFLQINKSGLYLFTNKFDNYFKTHIELYRIKAEYLKRDMNIIDHFAEKMQFDLKRTFNEDFNILSLYHEHDYDKILIRKPLKTGEDPHYSKQVLEKLKENLIQASQMSPISRDYDGVFNPIGKLFIFIHKLNLCWKKHTDEETIRIRIRTGAMQYESRPIVYTNQILINQGFLIPISNTFQYVKIQCYSIKDQGWTQDNKQLGKIMGVFSFNMVEFLTKPQRYLISRLVVKLENEINKTEKYETNMEISIQNQSDFSSIYSDSFSNQSDGVPLKSLKSIDDIGDLSLTVDRVLRILGTVALFIQAFWRNVYLFKYPRMGYSFFCLILINASLLQINEIVRQFIAIILLTVIYQQKYVKIFVQHFMNKYVFSKIHRSFKKPLMLSTSQVKYLKWSHQMNYISEDYQIIDGRLEKKPDKKRLVFQFAVHDRLFTVTEQEQSFFEKVKQAKKIIQLVRKMISTIVSTVEKLVNLLSWVDYKRTLFLSTLLLILTGLASGSLVRLLVSLFCIHRFYKGLFFYDHKHYKTNRMFAVYSMRYILQKSFPTIIGDKKTHNKMNLQSLDSFISNLVFPIHDEIAQKKLKLEMDEIMGVYLESQALYGKALRKNYLKIVHIIDAVESCQSRLKLNWVAGQQGISNQFQQLKQETREIPIIEIWLENAVINFIMNTPSQLFMAFYKEKLYNKNTITDNKSIFLNLSEYTIISDDIYQHQNKQTTSINTLLKQEKQLAESKKKRDEVGKGLTSSIIEKAEEVKTKIVILKQLAN